MNKCKETYSVEIKSNENNKSKAADKVSDKRDLLLKALAGDSSSNSSKFGIYYPGVGEYAPSRVIAGRIQ